MASLKDYPSVSITTSSNPLVKIYARTSPESTASAPQPKPALLLIHGFPQTHHIYNKVAPALAPHYSLILPDIRGYGASSTPAADPYNPDDHHLYAKSAMAADMSILMRKLGHERYFVCGHDRGARVAHKLAIDYPHEVKALLLLDICPTAAMYGCSRGKEFASAYWHWYFLIQPAPFPEEMLLSNPGLFANKQMGRLPGAGGAVVDARREIFGDEAWEMYEATLWRRENVHAMCEDYRASAQEDIREQAEDQEAGRRIRCRTRVLWGKFGVCEKLFDTKAEWRKVCGEGVLDEDGSEALECGHYIPEERPMELVEHIKEHLKD